MEKNLTGFYQDIIVPNNADSIDTTAAVLTNIFKLVPPPKKEKAKLVRFYIGKIAQLIMFGANISVNPKHITMLMQDKSYKFNRTGFLILSLVLNSNPDIAPSLFPVITEMLLDQKKHKNYFIGLALSAISVCPTPAVVRELGHLVCDIALSTTIIECIKAKALCVLATFYNQTKLFCCVEQVVASLPQLLISKSATMIGSAAKLTLSLLSNNQLQQNHDVFVSAIRVLATFVLGDEKSKQKKSEVQRPLIAADLFRILSYNKTWNDNEIQYLNAILGKLLVLRKTKREEREENSFMVIFTEAIKTLAKAPLDPKGRSKLISVLLSDTKEASSLSNRFSFEAILNLVEQTDSFNKEIYNKKGAILQPIYAKDRQTDYIALKIFTLISSVNDSASESILLGIIQYAGSWLLTDAQLACASVIMRDPNSERVFTKCVDMLLKGTPEFGRKIWIKLADFIEKRDTIQKSATEYCLRIIQNTQQASVLTPSFLQLTAFLAGNYGHLCDCGPNSVIETILYQFDIYDSTSQAMMITAMIKISTRVPELRAPAIDYLLDHLNSQSTEVVQRCREGASLLSSNDIVLKKSLTTPKYMGILYEFTPNQTPQKQTPTRRGSMHSPYSSYSQELAGHHVRKGSEGQWNSNLISPIKRVPTEFKFDLHENSPKSNLETPEESQVVLEPMSIDTDITSFQSNYMTMANSPIVPSLEHSEITKILETFFKEKKGVLFQDDNIAIYALIEEKLPVLTITYKIQNNSSIPMSIDKFEIPEELSGLQFVFGDRPSIIAANSFVLIRDHCRAVNAFQKYPLICASFNGWDYYLPCPVINRMFSNEIENVSQESFVERWKYLADKSMKQSVSNTPIDDKQINQVMMNALGWNKCQWSPQTRNAYIGSYKIVAANAGILIVFSITANNETCVEVRATEVSMLQPIINVIKNAVLDLV